MFDNIFGIHETALLLHGERLGVLTANLANADTPGYKARDIDFAAVLGNASEQQNPLPLAVTQASHIAAAGGRTAGRTAEVPQPVPGFPRRQHGGDAGGAGGVLGEQRALPGEPEFINDTIADLQLAIMGHDAMTAVMGVREE